MLLSLYIKITSNLKHRAEKNTENAGRGNNSFSK